MEEVGRITFLVMRTIRNHLEYTHFHLQVRLTSYCHRILPLLDSMKLTSRL
jgi:hypothetical protein